MGEEIAFPLLGAAVVLLVVLPAIALLTKAALVLLEREAVGGPLHGLDLRFLLLTASSAVPLAWFVSAGLHQAETGKSTLACLLGHDSAAFCFEPGLFSLILGLVAAVASLPVLRDLRGPPSSNSTRARLLAARVDTLLDSAPELSQLRQRVRIIEQQDFALATHGLLRPRVLIGVEYASTLSDRMLTSALGHEAEHLRSYDPLRYLALRLALAVNPVGRLVLEAHAARWQTAREAHCDREAVILGAAPLPLADAIIRAARPSRESAVALGAKDTAVLELRIKLLLAFAERPPTRCCHRSQFAAPIALALLMTALVSPHHVGTSVLDVLHTTTEHAFTAVF